MASPRRIDLIGIPLDLGAGRRGVDMGPSALRIAQLGGRLAALGHTVNDRGDLRHPVRETRPTGNARKKYIRDIARVCRQLYRASDAALEAGSTPVVLGGDHSVAAGSVAATAGFALGGRARRHEYPVDEYQRERAWHAARRLVGTGTG
jgi:arginase